MATYRVCEGEARGRDGVLQIVLSKHNKTEVAAKEDDTAGRWRHNCTHARSFVKRADDNSESSRRLLSSMPRENSDSDAVRVKYLSREHQVAVELEVRDVDVGHHCAICLRLHANNRESTAP